MHEAQAIPPSIRLLRALQPVVVALLGSPLHGLLSRDVLLLTYAGAKSGRRYTLPLSYVKQGGNLYLCTRPGGSGWWKNLRGGASVTLHLAGKDKAATALVLDSSSQEALGGLRAFLTRNPRTGRTLYDVNTGPGAKPDEEALRREVAHSVVVRVVVPSHRSDAPPAAS